MDSVDSAALKAMQGWLKAGHRITLATVVATFGSSPRPPGALLAIREDGQVAGSVSGGCVEDDLIERVRSQALLIEKPLITVYGVSREEAARFGLPCGGVLRLVLEAVTVSTWIDELLSAIERRELVARTLDLETGSVSLAPASRQDSLFFDAKKLVTIFGPRWRLLIIGAGQTSVYLAQMAQALDYEVIVCDPREEYYRSWDVPGTALLTGMPDDVALALELDPHSAVVALTHDPKLDDMALLEALKSPAFYVGALGSQSNNAKRRQRLALFDLSAEEIARLHGPVGLPIASRTPPEIAVSILAHLTQVKNQSAVSISHYSKLPEQPLAPVRVR